jgi:hypothetical protein
MNIPTIVLLCLAVWIGLSLLFAVMWARFHRAINPDQASESCLQPGGPTRYRAPLKASRAGR